MHHLSCLVESDDYLKQHDDFVEDGGTVVSY